MPQISLFDLPAEVHFEILNNALYSSQKPSYDYESDSDSDDDPGKRSSSDREGRIRIRWNWIEDSKRDLSQFPYNAAAVCQLWHDVLIQIPECWTRITIDVANDPSRFLDIFLWSKDLPNLEVTIFNSHTPESDHVEYSLLERQRVSAFVNALRPHISRCKYIDFDVAFLTSLPSPIIFLLEDNSYLEELYLECKIENAASPEEYSRICDLGVSEPIQQCSSFPELIVLSMTGFWFMFIAGHRNTSEWLKTTMQTGTNQYARLILTRFQFQKEGQYTLENFVSYLSELERESVNLCHLSLNHDGAIFNRKEYDQYVFLDRESTTFENVSEDVIQTLFFLADISPQDLTFDNCTFPGVALPSTASNLTLSNIPCSQTGPNAAIHASNTANLSSILINWSGSGLVVDSCPAFDDYVLSVLARHKSPTTLGDFELINCDNVTIHGVQQYLKKRNRHSAETTGTPADYEPLRCLNIKTTTDCPFLSDEDKEWFSKSEYASGTEICWSRRDPENSDTLQRFHKPATRM